MEPRPLLIGELSARTGCHIETIRYYERVLLLPRAQRRGRYRCYSESDVARFGFVMRARELGFTLGEIRALLQLSSTSDARTCSNAKELASHHLAKVRTRIGDLRRMERVLAGAIGQCGTRRTSRCPLIDALTIRPS